MPAVVGSITLGGRIIGTITQEDSPTPSLTSMALASYESMGNDEIGGVGGGANYGGGGYTGGFEKGGGNYPSVNIRDPVAMGGHKVYGRLAERRDRAREELKNDPALNEKAMHIFAGENPDPEASTKLWEETINRAAVRGTSLREELRRTNEGGYFAGWRDSVDPKTRKVLEESRDRALNHSNVSNYATDNASGGLAERDAATGHFRETTQPSNGEHFFGPDTRIPAHQKAWHDLVADSEAKRASDPEAKSYDEKQASNPAGTSPAIDGDTPRGSANLMHGQYGAPGENLTHIVTPSGKTATVHKDAAPSFAGFLGDLEKSGYRINSLGGYADRNKVGARGLSQHAYGNAVDINPDQNPQHGGTNLPSNVSDMAAKWGLTWGGDWSNRYRDPMHFEWTGRRPWMDKPAAVAAKPHEAPKAAPVAENSAGKDEDGKL